MLIWLFLAAALLGVLALGGQSQNYPGQELLTHQAYDSGLFTPLESLDVLSEAEFTSLTHPVFPRYNVRIKKTKFCDETVNSYTGYIDIEARHLFFYFFESRNDPDKDDVIFWTNGGPGCSSAVGLFMELGPCRIPSPNSTVHHPDSWNTNSNIFFIDQPVGVGFSYADHEESVSTSEEAAKDIAAFVAIFFEHFTRFKGRAFHMAGESYGGRYIPLFASTVYDQNAQLVEHNMTPINLQSVMIGNGLTDIFKMTLSYYDMQCTAASVSGPIFNISACVGMHSVLKRCEKWMRRSCIDEFDDINCGASVSFCRAAIGGRYSETGKNPYDITKECEGNIEETLCYPVTRYFQIYLNKPEVQKTLGVDHKLQTKNYTTCSHSVQDAFSSTLDILHPTTAHVAALLEHGVRALIYVGANDWICNWIGNSRWVEALDWTGTNAFGAAQLREWKVKGQRAGLTRSAKGLTFATIDGAGHMAPYDKPRESLALVQRWLANEDL